eukprot:279848-Amphidinium_carterae.1
MERIAEVENLKSALADLIKESRNKDVSLSDTAWTQKPPDGLKEFIDQVDVSEAEGLSALVMASTPAPRQEVVPTDIAIFSDIEVPPLRVAAPVTPVRSSTSHDVSFLASGDRRASSKTPFSSIVESSPEVAVRAGRVHVSPTPDGGGDGGGDDSPRRDEPRDPWHGEGGDPWRGFSNQPNHSRFGTSGAGGT